MSNKALGLIRLKLNQIIREAKNRIKYILPFRIYFFIPLIFPNNKIDKTGSDNKTISCYKR
jgi:hypothetical protein